MVEGSRRSRTLRRVQKKTPGSVTRKYYIKRKPNQAKCGNCGVALPGTPRATAAQMKNMSKTKKTPKRPFGGNLCTKCTRVEIIKRARK